MGMSINKTAAMVFSVLVMSCASVLQAKEKVQIFNVDVVGNKSASAAVILRNSGLVAGKAISGDDIRDAINRLWAMKVFSDVQITAEKQVEEGIFLTITVKE